jgi:hypothetical protein
MADILTGLFWYFVAVQYGRDLLVRINNIYKHAPPVMVRPTELPMLPVICSHVAIIHSFS